MPSDGAKAENPSGRGQNAVGSQDQEDQQPNDPKLAGLLALAARGFALHPLHNPIFSDAGVQCSCGDPHTDKPHKIGKHPRLGAWQHKATDDPEQIAEWHAKWPDANWGIATGSRSGIFVVDEDAPGAADALRKLVPGGKLEVTVITGTGSHCYLRYAGNDIKTATGKRSGDLVELLDIRGEGGYVVAPGSIHPNGKTYTWRDESEEIPEAPVALVAALRRDAHRDEHKPTPTASVATDTNLDQVRRALGELAAHRVADRDDWLHVGMAIKSVEPSDLGFEVWKEWSRGWDQFKESEWRHGGEHHRNWEHMTPDGGITAGKLFKLAAHDQERAGLIYAADTKPEPLRWCIPYVAAHGKLQGLIGLPDRGKDTIAIRMAADLSRGRVFGTNDAGRHHEPLPTYYQSAEDKLADTILPRFLAAGGDDRYLASRPAVRRNGVNEPLTFDARDLAVIRRDLTAIQSKLGTGPGLIVVSPFEAYLPGKVDSWKSADIRRVIAPLSTLLDETGWAGLLVAHLTKGNGDGGGAAIHRVVGSQAFAAALRIAYLVGDDPTSPVGTVPPARVFIPMKRNLIPPDVRGRSYTLASAPHPSAAEGMTHEERAQTVPVVHWGVETNVSAEDVLRGPGKINAADRAQTWLFEQFTRHGTQTPEGDFVLTTAKLKALAHDAGQPWNTVRKQFAAIGAVPEQHGKDGRFSEGAWRLREAF